MGKGVSAEKVVREIHRRTRRGFSAEEKIRIILEGLRGEESIAELCRREGLAPNLYYRWSKEFLEAGKKRSTGSARLRRGCSTTQTTALRRSMRRSATSSRSPATSSTCCHKSSAALGGGVSYPPTAV
jgi:transposase